MAERSYRIAMLPGDGIGPEVLSAAESVLRAVAGAHGFRVTLTEHLIGGAAVDAVGDPLPAGTLEACRESHAVLMGAVGGPKWDAETADRRPERGLLRLRKELGTFANLRPVAVPATLSESGPLRSELVAGVDMLFVRELTGGIYFGTPRQQTADEGCNTMRYTRDEVLRISRVAFQWARKRRHHVTSVDKANVLEVSRLWRDVVTEVARDFPDVDLDHMYVDNAAMQLVTAPRQFDVVLTANLFGDILSDLAATLPGSLGLLPSASLGGSVGLFEPVHGSAPDIAGKGLANPIGMISSMAMMLDALDEGIAASCVRRSVDAALASGFRTADIAGGASPASTTELTQEISRLVVPDARPV